jgi:uncharacterized damage-inducible protein DinB
MKKLSVVLVLAAAAAFPLFAQDNICKTAFVNELKLSRDFSLKVAEAMPDTDYNFKLTPAQMSFAEQMVHQAQAFAYFLSPFKGEKPNPAKPASMNKADVVNFVRTSFDQAIDTVSALTPEQLSKEYKGGDTGVGLLIAMMEHTAHHRASAEMYLRAKGITPPKYMD